MNSSLFNAVYFLDHNWHKDHRLPYLEAMAQHCRLLCVEPPITLDSLFRCPSVCKERGIRPIGPRLYLYRPLALVAYFLAWRFPTVGWLNHRLLSLLVRQVIRQLELVDFILILAHPVEQPLIGLLGERLLCYEVYDEWTVHPSVSRKLGQALMAAEKHILRSADIVFASSEHLAQSKQQLNPNTHFIPNAADTDHFGKSLDPCTSVPEDLARLPEPRIGLIGNINEIVDLTLINYLAEQRPEWSIVLIGQVNGGQQFLKSSEYLKARHLHNVRFLGRKNYKSLPAYQRGLDVCLLPYLINDYTRNVYPSKLHQYLAGGKPVVSTAMPEMLPFGDVIYIADNQAEFLALSERALQPTAPQVVKRRIAVARENSIEARAEVKVQLLREALDRKGSVRL
jgi:glycosyltransferase involved in cell wall biosynthesis